MKKPTMVAALIVTLCAVGTQARSMPVRGGMMGIGGGPGFGPEPGIIFPALLRNLGLTSDQMIEIRRIVASRRTALASLFPQLRSAQDALSAKVVGTAPVQLADVTADIERIAQLRKQLMENGVAVALEVRGVLTPAQLAKAAEMQQRFHALQDEMKSLLGDPPGPPFLEE